MMVVISAVVMTTVGSTVAVLDKRKTYLEVIRMKTRIELTENQLRTSAKSLGSLKKSASKNKGSALYRCLELGNCRDMDSYSKFTLYDAGGRRLSGRLNLNGEACQDNCPLEVRTSYQITCGGGASRCEQPADVRTQYVLAKGDGDQFGKRQFNGVEGVVSAATFACAENEYVTSISDDGRLTCSGPMASRFLSICPEGTAAYAMNEQGLFACSPVVDYCEEPIAFSYVIDTSGSMRKQAKLASAKTSSTGLLTKILKGDRASLTSYNTSAKNEAPLTTKGSDVVGALASLKAKGFTNMSAGLNMGAASLQGLERDKGVIVFLSDGHHNRGDQDPVAAAKAIKEQGIRIFTVGFGKKPDRDRLMKMASAPSDYLDAANAAGLDQAFAQITNVVCRK